MEAVNPDVDLQDEFKDHWLKRLPFEFQVNKLEGYVHSFMFSTRFTKGNTFCDFLFAHVDEEVLKNAVYSERKEFAPFGANSFL